jgi:hypothetical protein
LGGAKICQCGAICRLGSVKQHRPSGAARTHAGANPAGIDQARQPVVAIAGIVGHDGKLAGTLVVKGIEQMIGDPDGAEAATNSVDPSRTPATASAVVFTRLSITAAFPRDPGFPCDPGAK